MSRTPDGPILLLGSRGQLGSALASRLAVLGRVVCATRADADLEQAEELRALVRRVRPAVVVNAAAYTAVDKAETDAERCECVNAVAPGVVAEEVAAFDGAIVHFSTNYVFDGLQRAPYREEDPASPLSVYGATKLAGERRVIAANPRHLILRTAGVYDGHSRNFVRRILELAREREELRVVDDQLVAPTAVSTLADATVRALRDLLGGVPYTAPWGTYHITSSGSTSWHRFAERILELDPQRSEQVVKRVVPVTSAELAAPARRPANGLLDTTLFTRRFGVTLPPWDSDLVEVLAPPLSAGQETGSG